MKEIISSLRFDKVKRKNPDGGEYVSMAAYTIGLDAYSPKGMLSTVKEIILTESEGDRYFTIQFLNGEKQIVYPIAPFDYGTEITKTDKDE